MTEQTGWRRLIGHQGVLLATLELWPPTGARKLRHLQSGYRAVWSLTHVGAEHAVQEGPIDLVDARSLAPGTTGDVLIHPMRPEAWRGLDAGASLTLLGRRQHPAVIGEATILERRDVPDSAPLSIEPFVETSSRARLRAVPHAPSPAAAADPPTVIVAGAVLPLLSAYWEGTEGRQQSAPTTRTEEVELASALPRLDLEPSEPVVVTVTDGQPPVSAQLAYFSEVDADGIPAGDRRDARWDSAELLRHLEHGAGEWLLRAPEPQGARAAVIMLTFPSGKAGPAHNVASWGFRLP